MIIKPLRALKRKLRVRSRIKDAHRQSEHFLRNTKILGRFRIDQSVKVEEELGRSVQNYRILWPAQMRVSLNATENEHKFLKIAKYFNEGFYSRENIFTCEVRDAYYHVGTGLVCTKDWRAISDSEMEYRFQWTPLFKWFKPLRVCRLPGVYATVHNVFFSYWWHWLADCLPRIYLLHRAYPGQKIVLLVPREMGKAWHDSLISVLPQNFEIRILPENSWVKVDRMLLPSYIAARANGHIPPEFYQFLRHSVFTRFGLPLQNEPRERIYVSRALTKHCRLLNENEVIKLLDRYGFKTVFLEKMDFRAQVELFHRAEVVVAPYGSNWGNLLWAGKIKIFILYPDRPSGTHMYTWAKGLGQEHFFLASHEKSPWADFTVDVMAVEDVLKREIGLQPLETTVSLTNQTS